MLDFSDPRYTEVNRLCDAFASLNPHGDWDEDEWREFLKNNASPEIIDFIEEKHFNLSYNPEEN